MMSIPVLHRTAELELLARAIAAERYARVLQSERPPIPIVPALVRAIIRTNRRLRDDATRN